MRNQTQELNTSIHFLCLIHHKWNIITDKVWFNIKEGLTFIYDKNLWSNFYLSISRETIYILNILFLICFAQTTAIFLIYWFRPVPYLSNECPNMELEQMHVYSGYFHYYHRKNVLMDDQVCWHKQAYLHVSRHFQEQ